MLVLSRKEQEQILIGNGITIEVVRIRGNRVQLGIAAADNIRIRRVDNEISNCCDAADFNPQRQMVIG